MSLGCLVSEVPGTHWVNSVTVYSGHKLVKHWALLALLRRRLALSRAGRPDPRCARMQHGHRSLTTPHPAALKKKQDER